MAAMNRVLLTSARRPILGLLALLVGAVPFTSPARAQAPPVKITATKESDKEYRTTERGRYSKTEEGTESVFYKISIQSRATKALDNLQVKWALLVKPRWEDEPELIEGERKVNLGFGQTFTFQTDTVVLSGTKYKSTYGYSSKSGAELLGYSIEVYQDDKLIAAENNPGDTRRRIDALKQKRGQGGGGPKLHHF
jgi:hypothetical protein